MDKIEQFTHNYNSVHIGKRLRIYMDTQKRSFIKNINTKTNLSTSNNNRPKNYYLRYNGSLKPTTVTVVLRPIDHFNLNDYVGRRADFVMISRCIYDLSNLFYYFNAFS